MTECFPGEGLDKRVYALTRNLFLVLINLQANGVPNVGRPLTINDQLLRFEVSVSDAAVVADVVVAADLGRV